MRTTYTLATKPSDLRTYAGTVIIVVVTVVIFHPPVAVVGAITGLVVGLGQSFVKIRRSSRR